LGPKPAESFAAGILASEVVDGCDDEHDGIVEDEHGIIDLLKLKSPAVDTKPVPGGAPCAGLATCLREVRICRGGGLVLKLGEPIRKDVVPNCGGAIPIHPGELPLGTGGAPIRTGGVPKCAGGVLLRASGVLLRAEGVLLRAEGVPMGTGGVPMVTGVGPLSTGGVPIDAGGATTGIEEVPITIDVPCDGDGVLHITIDVPVSGVPIGEGHNGGVPVGDLPICGTGLVN